ncbi:MAG: DUF7144 family membrane protein [Frankiaceae bacterium]
MSSPWLAGFAVMARATWARVVGIILTCISVILNFAYMAAFPGWS